ncbi:AraC family transcriptional regulator [Nocardia concava]|uniref:AraC family transcriptional regulator n=1 Tax=Nocardia concava TaxID=257281 RepID=UPI0002F2E5EC|nr:AraC family transcriptional regulator [Nocardia concava]
MSYFEIDDLARSETGGDAHRDVSVHQILLLMSTHPARSWTIAELAVRVHLSRAAFTRRFTKTYGKAPISMLTSIRLEMAAEMLCSTNKPLDLIANHVGYGSAFALSRAFKREYGLSPRDYRQNSSSERPEQRVDAGTGRSLGPALSATHKD